MEVKLNKYKVYAKCFYHETKSSIDMEILPDYADHSRDVFFAKSPKEAIKKAVINLSHYLSEYETDDPENKKPYINNDIEFIFMEHGKPFCSMKDFYVKRMD